MNGVNIKRSTKKRISLSLFQTIKNCQNIVKWHILKLPRTAVNRTPFVIMTRLYKTLVRPHVEYGMPVWSPETGYWWRRLNEGLQSQYRVYRVWIIMADVVNWACGRLNREGTETI